MSDYEIMSVERTLWGWTVDVRDVEGTQVGCRAFVNREGLVSTCEDWARSLAEGFSCPPREALAIAHATADMLTEAAEMWGARR